MGVVIRVLALIVVLFALAACGGGDGEEERAAFCARFTPGVRQVDKALADSVAGRDPAAGRRRLATALGGLDQLADAAPDEIDGEVELVARAVRDYRDALAGADPDDPVATRAALETIQGNRDEIEEASASLREYASDECAVELGGTSTTSTQPAPPANAAG